MANKDQPRSKVLPFQKKGMAQKSALPGRIDISASSGRRDPPLSEDDLQTAVARAVNSGTVRQSFHSDVERSHRNISYEDIIHMLGRTWKLDRKPEYDEEHQNWKYRLAGEDFEGDELVLIVAVDTDENRITIITKF